MKLKRSLLVLFALFLSCTVLAQTQPAADYKLPRDDKNVYGQFDNGLKYIVRHNTTPPGKFTAYLHVDSGALNESPIQNGLAHFLEHMAFRSTKNYPDGKLVPFLNQMGMLFGADTNAHTNFNETVYKLVLPDNKAETIATAMTIFSDYASAITLDAADIEHERGVILEEHRTRTGVDYRVSRAMAAQLYSGTMLEKHDIIGDAEQIKKFPQEEFKKYWDNWYRPEKMTLIVAGDIDPEQVIAVAKEKLGSFKARGEKLDNQKSGLQPFASPKAFVITDPEQVKAEVRLDKMRPRRDYTTTYKDYRRDLTEDIGEWIINHRIANEISSGKAPYREAAVWSGNVFGEVYEVEASGSGNPQDWQKMLDSLIIQIKRGIDHGFSEHEIKLAKQDILSKAEWAVKNEQSIDSSAYVISVARAVGYHRPLMSAQQTLDVIKQALGEINKQDIQDAFNTNYQNDTFAYVAVLPAAKDGESPVSSEQVMNIVTGAWARPTEAPTEGEVVASILASEPQAGKVVAKEYDEQLGLLNVVFENGVVLHHKFSDYKKDQIIVNLVLPGGLLQEKPENKGISSAASAIFSTPATHRANSSQMRDLLVGKNFSLTGNIGLDSMSMRLKGIKSDLPTGLQLVHALLTDATIEQSTLDDWKQNQLKALKERKTDAEDQLTDLINDQIYGADPRIVTVTPEHVNAQQRETVEKWFHQIAGQAAIEVTVVGDISSQDCVALISQYIGSLPKRTGGFADLDSLRQIKRADGPYSKLTNFHSVAPKAIALAGFITCNELDPERRPLSLVGLIMTDRMVQRIRVAEQLVYSINCRNSPGRAIPNTGMMMSAAPTDPKNAQKLVDTAVEMLKQFAESGPTEAELETAKKQIANQLSTQMKDPEWWVVQLSELTYKNRKLEDIKALPGVFQQFTTDDLKNVANKYFTDDRMIKLQAVPR